LKDLTEKFVSGEDVFHGTLLKVRRDVVELPDGTRATREYVLHPGAVAIVALAADGSVVLERQHRYPMRRDFVEIPAGKLEKGEVPLDTAKRELREETGYAAAEWTRLGVLHNAIGYSDETIEFWLARGLEKGERSLDAGEFLEVFSLPLPEAVQKVKDGEITDAKTIAGLIRAAAFLKLV
jgi:ADP-ribose pyrophosphatase